VTHVSPITQSVSERRTTHPPCATRPADSFPFEWIKKKWREAFHVTAMATSGTQVCREQGRG
jgi:hypothetical protein